MEPIDGPVMVPYAGVIVKLLRGPLFQEDKKHWSLLMANQAAIRAYFEQIGVLVHLSEADGFAYLTQAEVEPGDESIPRLIKRVPLSYEVTLLLVILRESLEEFDHKAMYASACFITDEEIRERIGIMLGEKTDRVKLLSRFDSYINQAVSLGFLKEVTSAGLPETVRRFEIRRIIRAKVSNEKLEEIKERIESHDPSV